MWVRGDFKWDFNQNADFGMPDNLEHTKSVILTLLIFFF